MRIKVGLIVLLALATGFGILPSRRTSAEIVTFQEDFSSWQFRDESLTTADWDTLGGQLRLFPVGLDSLGTATVPGTAYASALSDTLMFVADGSGTLLCFGVSVPSQAHLLDSVTTLDGARDVTTDGSWAFVSVGNSGLQTVNTGDPGDLVTGGNLDLDGFAYGLAQQGNRLFVAQSGFGVAVVDISTPWNPTLVVNAPGRSWTRDVSVHGSQLLVADSDSGLTIMDISQPDSPSIIGSLVTSSSCLALDTRNNRAFLALGSGGLAIVDIADPADPVPLGNLTFPGNSICRNVTASGDTIFAAVNDRGLFVVDVTEPQAPVIIGNRDTPGTAYQAAVDGTVCWLADGIGGMRAFELNPLALDENRNQAVSLNIGAAGEPVTRARLTAAAITDSVRFDLSVDGGLSWIHVQPEDDWVVFEEPGEDFRWRAMLFKTGPEAVPTCSRIDLTYEKLHGYGGIESVTDVPGDTGGQVRVVWSPSRFDTQGSEYLVTEYSVYRRFDDGLAKSGNPAPPYPEGSWDFITTVPADMETTYAAVVPTLRDSTASQGMAWSVFFVRTRTATPGVFFDSPPDSGYSVNNLQPDPPTGFVVDRSPVEGNLLTWDPPADPDFAHFRIYRATSPLVPPLPGTLFQVTTGTQYLDTETGTWYYQLTLVNLSGQESEPASSLSPVPAPGNGLRLFQNTPNPFNPITSLHFQVPGGGTEIRLEIFDPRGHLVRVLHDGFLAAGNYSRPWNGRDDQGRQVGSGVYYGRISGAGQTAVVKMVLVR